MKMNLILAASAFAIAGWAPMGAFGEESNVAQPKTSTERIPFLHGLVNSLPSARSELASLERAGQWLNSTPLTASALRGKVVLVDFWTYTCVNWLRTLPYVRAWAQKYRDNGLVVVGVHSPEFPFEKNIDNIRRAVKDLRVDYPIAVDGDHVIWRAFSNQYWPALYFIDAEGRVRYTHFGEGSYEQSEMMIQQLLVEAGNNGIGRELVSVDPKGLEVAANWSTLKSPENYVGYDRTEGLVSRGVIVDQPHVYELPTQLRLNEWALSGAWTVKRGLLAVDKSGGRLVYRFHARDVNLVMGPPAPGVTVKYRVRIDGEPPGAAHGADVGDRGEGKVSEQRTYQLIRQQMPVADRQLEIEFIDPGAELFSFTFG